MENLSEGIINEETTKEEIKRKLENEVKLNWIEKRINFFRKRKINKYIKENLELEYLKQIKEYPKKIIEENKIRLGQLEKNTKNNDGKEIVLDKSNDYKKNTIDANKNKTTDNEKGSKNNKSTTKDNTAINRSIEIKKNKQNTSLKSSKEDYINEEEYKELNSVILPDYNYSYYYSYYYNDDSLENNNYQNELKNINSNEEENVIEDLIIDLYIKDYSYNKYKYDYRDIIYNKLGYSEGYDKDLIEFIIIKYFEDLDINEFEYEYEDLSLYLKIKQEFEEYLYNNLNENQINDFIEEVCLNESKDILHEDINYQKIVIKKISEERKINNLIHFTNLENLKSILDKGIIPVGEHNKYNIKAISNDESRYDFNRGATSTSIEFPNYKFFYKLIKEHPLETYIILKLSKSILWEKNCYFYKDNAAKKKISNFNLNDLKVASSFYEMFLDMENKTRELLNIPINYTTNPQAEVMINDIIEPNYIEEIIFKSYEDLNNFKKNNRINIKLSVDKKYFSARIDYQYW